MDYKFESAFPGGIGFVNEDAEIYVRKENLFARNFCPHFFLYNHATGEIQKVRFTQLDSCNEEVLIFLNTIRTYSLDRTRHALSRTYYIDLITEWEIVNKQPMKRKFLWI